jgi:hypothetical protein
MIGTIQGRIDDSSVVCVSASGKLRQFSTKADPHASLAMVPK